MVPILLSSVSIESKLFYLQNKPHSKLIWALKESVITVLPRSFLRNSWRMSRKVRYRERIGCGMVLD